MLLAASDHVIDDVPGVHVAVCIARDRRAREDRLVTFGIMPTRAGNRLWLHPPRNAVSWQAPGAFAVAQFVEKPDRATAERFVQSGDYLWNASLFLFSPARLSR